MKKIYISVALLMATITQAQTGVGTPNPHTSAMLEVQAQDKGFLLPRVALTSLTDGATPINNPAEGLLIYNTKADPTLSLEKGFYVWDGASWKRFATQDELEAQSFWKPQGTASLRSARNTTPSVGVVDEDIFQKGKVGIGYSSSYDIDFDVNVTQKQLEVGGDFRTSFHHVDSLDLTKNSFFGFETNSIALPQHLAVRANVMYNASTKNLEKYSMYEEKYDGSILIQAKDKMLFLSRTGIEGDADGTNFYENQQTSGGSTQFVGNAKVGVYENYFKNFNKSGFNVGSFGNSDHMFGIDFDRGNFFIGNYFNSNGYYFPNVKGIRNQVLTFEDSNELIWKNPLDILTPGTANQVLLTNAAADGVVWVDQSTIVPATTVANTITGTTLTTTVNGVGGSVDLGPTILAHQKTASVVNGTTTTVTSATVLNDTAYTVEVKDGAISTVKLANDAVTSDKILDGTIATADLANNSITTDKIADGAVINTKLTAGIGVDNRVGVADAAGAITYTNLDDLNIKATPKFFYMPSIIFDTTVTGTALKRNLHAEYLAQFTGMEFIPNTTTGGEVGPAPSAKFIASASAPAIIPNIPGATDLYYYVTDYDTTALANLSIDENGVLTYDVIGTGTDYSFVNIVFVVK